MLEILYFRTNLLFHNSVEGDTQLVKLRFERGKLGSLLKRQKAFQPLNGSLKELRSERDMSLPIC